MKLTKTVADRIAARMRRDGFDDCTTADVFAVYRDADLPGRESLASRILQEFDEYEVTPGG